MKELEEVKKKVLGILGIDTATNTNANMHNAWIEWIHEGSVPAKTNVQRTLNLAGMILLHCPMCLNLNGCRFAKNNAPDLPLHPKCHCKIMPVATPIVGISAFAECDIKKFTNYIFDDKYISNGKKALFESWGYGIMDSSRLQEEYIKQASKMYAEGNYTLDKLDAYGQIIVIELSLTKSNGENVNFASAWSVYPDGVIKLVTPFGGWL